MDHSLRSVLSVSYSLAVTCACPGSDIILTVKGVTTAAEEANWQVWSRFIFAVETWSWLVVTTQSPAYSQTDSPALSFVASQSSCACHWLRYWDVNSASVLQWLIPTSLVFTKSWRLKLTYSWNSTVSLWIIRTFCGAPAAVPKHWFSCKRKKREKNYIYMIPSRYCPDRQVCLIFKITKLGPGEGLY